jgi:hypothetical protein
MRASHVLKMRVALPALLEAGDEANNKSRKD